MKLKDRKKVAYKLKELSPNTPLEVVIRLLNVMKIHLHPYNSDGSVDDEVKSLVNTRPELFVKLEYDEESKTVKTS